MIDGFRHFIDFAEPHIAGAVHALGFESGADQLYMDVAVGVLEFVFGDHEAFARSIRDVFRALMPFMKEAQVACVIVDGDGDGCVFAGKDNMPG